MFWLLYCGLFLLMLFSIVRMLNQRGKWAWVLFLGLIASVAAYVGLFILPVASSSALQRNPTLLVFILVAGTALYVAALVYGIRRFNEQIKSQDKASSADI